MPRLRWQTFPSSKNVSSCPTKSARNLENSLFWCVCVLDSLPSYQKPKRRSKPHDLGVLFLFFWGGLSCAAHCAKNHPREVPSATGMNRSNQAPGGNVTSHESYKRLQTVLRGDRATSRGCLTRFLKLCQRCRCQGKLRSPKQSVPTAMSR